MIESFPQTTTTTVGIIKLPHTHSQEQKSPRKIREQRYLIQSKKNVLVKTENPLINKTFDAIKKMISRTICFEFVK